MHQDGLRQADERFERMRQCAGALASTAPLAEREQAWFDLVQAFGTLYSKLEQAAKTSSDSRKWFETKKVERKRDPLLSYMLHARNAGEHTLVRPAGAAEFAVSARYTGRDGMIGFSFDERGRFVPTADGVADVRVYENEILLNAAIDRGVHYRPPEEHLGQQIDGSTAKNVAPMVIAYADSMLREAKALKPLTVEELEAAHRAATRERT